MKRVLIALAAILILNLAGRVDAGPPPIPQTRQELKQALEKSKTNVPRLPLPELSEAEKREAAAKSQAGELFPIVNNRRMRERYLPKEVVGGGFSRKADPAMTLNESFKTMFFWIASRANNCEYCLGHQESKLAAAGVTEDRVAALDGDWLEFLPAERSAFALVKLLTIAPHKVQDQDILALKTYYNDRQILEIVFASAGHNAMNRWTGALRIPQEEFRRYLTPTSDRDRDRRGSIVPATAASRPPLESREIVAAKLAEAQRRTPRIAPVSESQARAALPPDAFDPQAPIPQWARLLAHFPEAGKLRVVMNRGAAEAGELDPLLKAQIAWIAARHDRAWYALGLARKRLRTLGLSDERIFALDREADANDNDEAKTKDADKGLGRRAAFALARKLTIAPATVEDEDIAVLRKHFTDTQVAEIVFQITEAAFFNRLTEAAGLPLSGDNEP